MLRLETPTGYWLVTHPDHAHLAGAIASHWGNDLFTSPEPRTNVLLGINSHDDGWAQRDASPSITRQGKPSAFSVELVGKYSAFEEIDLQDYLNVRDRAVAEVAAKDAYAALLVSKHTYNLLTARADRSTISPDQLPLLDAFLESQRNLQSDLLATIRADSSFTKQDTSDEAVEDHFRLLQACDNMSLIACVDFTGSATLIHPLLTSTGHQEITVTPLGDRAFRLTPYPLSSEKITIEFPARHVPGKTFTTSSELATLFAAAPIETLTLTLSA
ncbi:hypothetical protein HDF16_002384 [Granulicella aggregans]|uniref:DUF3891 family protein n=1 Tax=Granulicella aggregans TaxID=474949 RepID=A0A7W8E375_9BACT|nr:DUF3891 family protein [Granulicella aggregans]MBB5057678.1 hypothetical protein [Granulicella aggregans]